MRCIGYVGEEAFDVILYTSRILVKLNYEVLITDFTDSNALRRAICHGMDLDSTEQIVNYRGINYTRRMPSEDEISHFNKGVVFAVYGYHNPMEHLLPCNEWIAVLNTFPHVIDKINTLLKNTKDCLITRILIRDVIDMSDMERVKEGISLPIAKDNMDHLYLDYGDYTSALQCQITQMIRLTDISSGLMKYLIKGIQSIIPGMKQRQIKRAMKAVRKGW